MKKFRIIVLALLLILLPSMLFAQAKPIVLRLAETHPKGYPTELGDEEFARLVKERSNGRIIIEVYPGSQLGEEKAVIEQVQFGAIDITRVSISPVAAFVPKLNAFQMPYLYRDSDHMWKVLKGDIGMELLASLEPFGFIGLGWFEAGARSFYNSKKPVYAPADLKGMKIRVQESELMLGLVRSFGAIPTPMPYGEVYSGLQTGVVDGAENNPPSYYSASHYEVAKYYTLDEHTMVPEIIIGSKISLGRLSKADQDLIKKAAMDAIDYQRAEWDAYVKVSMDKVKEAGCTIIPIPDKTEWMKAVEPMYKQQPKEIQDLVARIRAVK